MKTSAVGDLTQLAKEVETLFKKKFGSKPGLAIAFTLGPEYKDVHWVTNVSRQDGVTLFKETAQKMQSEMN